MFPFGPSLELLKDSSIYLNTADSDRFHPKAPSVTFPLTFESFYSSTEGSWLIGKP
jgi:hypothetical protein